MIDKEDRRCKNCNYYSPKSDGKGLCELTEDEIMVDENHLCDFWEEVADW